MRIWVGIGIFVLILIAGFALFIFRTSEAPIESGPEESSKAGAVFSSTYEDGVHTITGTASLKNRCQRLEASASVDTSTTPQTVRVDLLIPQDTGICLELVEEREFEVKVEAPADAVTKVFVNGVPAEGTAL